MQERTITIHPEKSPGACTPGEEGKENRVTTSEIIIPVSMRPGRPQIKEKRSSFLGLKSETDTKRLFFSRIKYHKREKAGNV